MALDFDGERYALASVHQKEWGAKLIEGRDLNGDERILGMGCGDGVLTARLAERVPRGHVIGIDASPGMLQVARRHESDRMRFELRDMNDLRYDAEFDLIFSNAAIHFVKDQGRLLNCMHRALRDGGVARCNFAADGNCVHYFKVVRKAMRAPEFAAFFEDFAWPYCMPPVDDFRDLVVQVPFQRFEVWGENADRHFPNEDALSRWIDQPSIVPFLKRVEEPFKDAFRNTVVDGTIALTRQEDGTCFEVFRRVNLFAVK